MPLVAVLLDRGLGRGFESLVLASVQAVPKVQSCHGGNGKLLVSSLPYQTLVEIHRCFCKGIESTGDEK